MSGEPHWPVIYANVEDTHNALIAAGLTWGDLDAHAFLDERQHQAREDRAVFAEIVSA